VRNPRFFILDEAMSALDLTREVSIRRAIQLPFKGRSVLLITHRL
jgi:ABC-type multidrug transport system fused ATPase/permease subunit